MSQRNACCFPCRYSSQQLSRQQPSIPGVMEIRGYGCRSRDYGYGCRSRDYGYGCRSRRSLCVMKDTGLEKL